MPYASWKMPAFVNGVRVTPYHGGAARRCYRVDIKRPGNGFDLAFDDVGDDAARIRVAIDALR